MYQTCQTVNKTMQSTFNSFREKSTTIDKIAAYASTTVILTMFVIVLVPQIIVGSISLYTVTHHDDAQCSGWSGYSINEYLYVYGIATMVVCASLVLSMFGGILLLCDLMVIPVICFVITGVCVVAYGVFLVIWRYIGIVVLIYTFNCHVHVLPQYVCVVFTVLFAFAITFTNSDSKKESTNESNV